MILNIKKNIFIYLIKDIKFLVLCLFTFFLGYEYWDEAYIFGGFTITKALGLLYFTLSIVYLNKSFSINRDNLQPLVCLLILTFLIILSTLNAHIFSASDLNISSILFFIQFFIFYWAVSNEVRNSRYKKNILFIFFILGVLSIYILAVNGIGLQASNKGDSLDSTEEVTRLWFMGMNPNTLGNLATLASILLVYLLLNSNIAFFKKVILLPLLIPFIHLIFLSGSLGALISLTIGLFILLFLDKKIFFSHKIIFLFLFLFLFYLYMGDDSSGYLLDKLDLFINTGNTSGRIEIWQNNLEVASESFIFGLGLDTGLRTSHNVFLDVFVWTGILGLLTYALFMLSTFRVSILNTLKYNSSLELAIFLVILLVLFKSGGGFQIKYIWLFLAIISVPSEKRNISHVK